MKIDRMISFASAIAQAYNEGKRSHIPIALTYFKHYNNVI